MNQLDEIDTVRVVPGGTVDERIAGMSAERKEKIEEELRAATQKPARSAGVIQLATTPNLPPTELRAHLIERATDLAENAYLQMKQAVDMLGVVDLRAHEKYDKLLRGMGSAVKDFSEKM